MRIVSFVNKKGGVGKSSAVMHLGGAFAKMGLRTLLVDVDPQASLSQGLLGPLVAMALPSGQTLAAIFEEACPAPLASLVMEIGRPRLALVAGHDRMTDFNVPRPWETGADQFILRDALVEVADDFDLALLDCPPHIQACAWGALVASDGVVVPAQLEDFGIQGVSVIQDSIEHAKASANSRLTLLGFLPTMFTKTLSIHAKYDADLRAVYGEDVFRQVIPAAKDFKESVTLGKSIVEHKPKSKSAEAINLLALEVLARLDARCGVMSRSSAFAPAERIGA